ncbi:unnamed protein product [Anisakis simplex]|uniref:Uncharacterized protein n=1 Tax=Anisakis simplex TaxID=6269 RepID=A0A3P6NPJ0_ANISI|nr:unnamed protein product [Anisakis simplex]
MTSMGFTNREANIEGVYLEKILLNLRSIIGSYSKGLAQFYLVVCSSLIKEESMF